MPDECSTDGGPSAAADGPLESENSDYESDFAAIVADGHVDQNRESKVELGDPRVSKLKTLTTLTVIKVHLVQNIIAYNL